jgi:cytochrome c-type biogenesis protein
MAARSAPGRAFADRRLAYLILAIGILLPVLAFGIGPLTSSSWSLNGPAGPALAFSAGVLSFVSPCVLPIVPIYITHLSGATVEGGRVQASRQRTFLHALAFIGGLSFVFIVLGSSAGLLGSYFFRDNQREMEEIAGVLLAAMGVLVLPELGRGSPIRSAVALLVLSALYLFIADVADLRGDREGLAQLGIVLLLAWLRFSGYLPLSFFSRTFEVNVGRNRQVGYTKSLVVGGAFALGWTPCIGPILGSILTLAATSSHAWTGTYLLVAYSAGFSVPFLITGLMLGEAQTAFRQIQRYAAVIEVVSAVMLVGLGLLLWYGRLSGLNSYFAFGDGTPKL